MFTDAERQQYEKERMSYDLIQENIKRLNDVDKRAVDKINSVDIGKYDASSKTMLLIADIYSNNAINAFNTIFKLGFMKGKKSMKSKVKKIRK